MTRNLKLYPWFMASIDLMAWLPVFFLYFMERVSLKQALMLEAIYYICVVATEVPSGYFSDRFGRRRALIVASLAFCSAYICFILSQQFYQLAIAQILLAVGIAFRSGSDTALLHDSLLSLGKQHEYANRDALAARASLSALTVAALLGGVSANYDLRLTYGVALLGAISALFIALALQEPCRNKSSHSYGFINQLKACAITVKNGPLSWLLAFYVAFYVWMHVPYEFYQPYLKLLESKGELIEMSAPTASGLLIALTTGIAAWVAGYSVMLRDRLGAQRLFLGALAIQLMVIGGLSLVLHPAIVFILLLRNAPSAAIQAPLNAEIAPWVPNHLRATYLSLQSLAGRLGFALLLLSLAAFLGKTTATEWLTLKKILQICGACGLMTFLCLLLWGKRFSFSKPPSTLP